MRRVRELIAAGDEQVVGDDHPAGGDLGGEIGDEAVTREDSMCRNIRPLHNFAPPEGGNLSAMPTRQRNVSAIVLRLPQRRQLWLFDCGEATQHQLLRTSASSSSRERR